MTANRILTLFKKLQIITKIKKKWWKSSLMFALFASLKIQKCTRLNFVKFHEKNSELY